MIKNVAIGMFLAAFLWNCTEKKNNNEVAFNDLNKVESVSDNKVKSNKNLTFEIDNTHYIIDSENLIPTDIIQSSDSFTFVQSYIGANNSDLNGNITIKIKANELKVGQQNQVFMSLNIVDDNDSSTSVYSSKNDKVIFVITSITKKNTSEFEEFEVSGEFSADLTGFDGNGNLQNGKLKNGKFSNWVFTKF